MEAPPPSGAECVPEPAMFDDTCQNWKASVAQPPLNLYSHPAHFPVPTLQLAYAFNRLGGRAQAQILPCIQDKNITITGLDAIITLPNNVFGNPNSAATA